MEYTIGNNYSGFELKQLEKIEELDSLALVFEHVKTGAKALLISNNDDNKSFSISFRTPPTDHTGLPHILEHSVLCGSKNFPVKDPFVELIKGSLNTFLNAMTFSDKTMYPVASCNDKDFQNLMHVYMDAVFYPNIYSQPEIFHQEGWHYELQNPEDELTIKGVVYNEMKGAFSSPEQVLFRKIQASLFPDNCYSKESGGDPEYIPDLTEEEFLDFHKKYYHPSNSYIFLYGDYNIDEKLQWLDEEYLSKYEKINIDSTIQEQKQFESMKEEEEVYSISSNKDINDKTYLSYNFATGSVIDPDIYYGMEILEYLLLETTGAPLKMALLEAGIGKDIFGSFDNSILQPTFSIVAKDANVEDKEKFVEVITNTLKKIVDEGIDEKKIKSAINYFEFKFREADFGRYPKGVIYSMQCMNSWLYDADPLMYLKYSSDFERFKAVQSESFFENLIEKYLLNNTHSTVVIVKPEKGLTAKMEQEVSNKLKVFREGLTEENVKEIIGATHRLEKYQDEDTPEEMLEKIPLLDIEDIKKEPQPIDLEVVEAHNIKVLLHDVFSNNIGYVGLIFDIKKLPEYLIPYAGLLASVLGKVDTEQYKYDDLTSEINIHTGGIAYTNNVYTQMNDSTVFMPKFEVNCKAFYDKIPQAFDLIDEILFHSKLDDEKRLYEIISEVKSRVGMQLNSAGHSAAVNRVQTYFSNGAYFKELLGGIEYYKFIDGLQKEFKTKKSEIIHNLKEIVTYIFRKENLVVSYTAEKSAYGIFENELEGFLDGLYTEEIKEETVEFNLTKKNEGYMTPAKIQYVAKAGRFDIEGYKYSGNLRVLQTIAGLNYLWNNVRVKGGAYGAMCGFNRNGVVYFTSYRDPNLKETLDVYDNLYSYIKTFQASERDMTKFIIGTISKMDTPLSPMAKGSRGVNCYFSKLSYEDLKKEREEVLASTSEDIRNQSELINKVLHQDNICVIGNETKLEANKDLFGNLVPLF